MLHIDTQKPGRIVRPGHRVTGNRRDGGAGAGWETLFVAIDDLARIALTALHPDEKTPQAVRFLKAAVAYYAELGVSIKRLLSDNGSAFRSTRLRSCLPGARNQAPVHTDQPAADEWKGREVQPVGAARVRLRLDVSELVAPSRGTGQPATLVQLAPPAQRHWRSRPDAQTQLVEKQRLDTSHLSKPACF